MKTINLMEVCGTHTMSIAKAGIKTVLPEELRLLSGPGCPVCVTPPELIDAVLKLSEKEQVLLATYGDMLKVPGSRKGDSLAKRKALGANVEMVYSPMDALQLAEAHPEKEVVFLGVGFETTAPGTAACIKVAKEKQLTNFSVYSMLKTMEPVLRKLLEENEDAGGERLLDGLICPGHVAVIIGEEGFRFLEEAYHIPAVIAGFEPEEILLAIKRLAEQIHKGEGKLENAYPGVVRPEGNLLAKKMVREVFAPCDAVWRGLSIIEKSGLQIREEYADYDAAVKYNLTLFAEAPFLQHADRNHTLDQNAQKGERFLSNRIDKKLEKTGCRCGDVVCGRIDPVQCPLFGKACTPADPEGPCMVSSEGACAAAYKYRDIYLFVQKT